MAQTANGYIENTEYATATGRPAAEATDARIKRASRLLDARIGSWTRKTSGTFVGWKLDLSLFDAYRSESVVEWVSWLVATLFDSNDVLDAGGESVRLGKFQVNRSVVAKTGYPAKLQYADEQLVDANMVKLYQYDDVTDLPVA